jgi:hypothetical protein
VESGVGVLVPINVYPCDGNGQVGGCSSDGMDEVNMLGTFWLIFNQSALD